MNKYYSNHFNKLKKIYGKKYHYNKAIKMLKYIIYNFAKNKELISFLIHFY